MDNPEDTLQPEVAPQATPEPTAAPAPAPKGKRTVRTQVKETSVLATTAEKVTTTAVQNTEVDELPARVVLAAPYAFYDDDGALRSWGQGRVVEDPAEIALLIDRGAIFEA